MLHACPTGHQTRLSRTIDEWRRRNSWWESSQLLGAEAKEAIVTRFGRDDDSAR